MMIVDARALFVLGYNFTKKDIDKSRSLGVAIDDDGELVTEARRLFDCDFDRKPYSPELDRLVVSPLNSRSRLMSLIDGATTQLLIYDARLTDSVMQRAIEKRASAGVEVKLIGQSEKKLTGVTCEGYPGNRLHVRAMVRDGVEAFVGSQSLRRTELERRREIGVIINDPSTIGHIVRTFESDWAQTDA
jgi:phosphatidylserine/phosphatidylglycerophosphate/cardiolipin synthase-like enzyme